MTVGLKNTSRVCFGVGVLERSVISVAGIAVTPPQLTRSRGSKGTANIIKEDFNSLIIIILILSWLIVGVKLTAPITVLGHVIPKKDGFTEGCNKKLTVNVFFGPFVMRFVFKLVVHFVCFV